MRKKLQNKKFKTPITLRFRLLKMVLFDNYHTKYAAKILNINYSTAKVIIKENRQSFFQSNLLSEIKEQNFADVRAGYRKIDRIAMMPTENQEKQKFYGSEGSYCLKNYKPIEIISRSQWNFQNFLTKEKIIQP